MLGYPQRMQRSVVVVTAFVGAFASLVGLAGCQDPCVTLAERICNCEATADERRACIADRITNQQNTVKVDDADREVCTGALDTCTCAALDQNNLAACGFSVDDGSGQ